MEVIAMNEMDKQLQEKKEQIQTLQTPVDFENRLKNALNSTENPGSKKQTWSWKLAMVSMVLVVTLVGFNFNAVAYYGKKLIGFDDLVSDSLNDLNEEGFGQIIDKAKYLQDGSKFTIDGIMSDANRFILYYTITNEKGFSDPMPENLRLDRITGFLTNSMQNSGTAKIMEGGTKIKGVFEFDPVNSFAKKLTFHYFETETDGSLKESTITFPYNPNEAMLKEIKQSINQTIKVDQGTITFKSISATPTMTVIKGEMDVDNFDRLPSAFNDIILYANGEPILSQGSGFKSSIFRNTFELRYDALPEKLENLELKFNKFIGYQKVEEKVQIEENKEQETQLYSNFKLLVKNMDVTPKGLEITIITDQEVLLDEVSISYGDGEIPLETTLKHMIKTIDGKEVKERVLLFDTDKLPDYLNIGGIHYMKEYSEVITIPIK